MRALISAIASFVFPGYGHAVIGRTRTAYAWAIAFPVAILLVFVSMWFFLIAFALRLLAAGHAFVSTNRATTFDWYKSHAIVVVVIATGSDLGVRAAVFEGFKTPSSSMYPSLQIGDDIFIDKLSPHWRPYRRGDVVVFAYPCDPARSYIKRIMATAGDTLEVRCNVVYVNGKAVPNTLVSGPCTYDDRDDIRGTWIPRECSRYHETVDSHGYDVFHDPQRPERDRVGAPEGDNRDFPQRERPILPSCSQTAEANGATPTPRGKFVELKANATSCEQQLQYVIPEGSIFVMGDNRSNSNDSRIWGVVTLDAIKGRAIGIWLADGEHGIAWSRIGPID